MAIIKELQKELSEFCSQSTIHGMSNVSNANKSFYFRMIWLIIVIGGFILAGICIKESVDGNIIDKNGIMN
jgi:hypothetical protein